MSKQRRNVQRGMFLIEVLVSVTILALGLIGLAGLQARALMMNQSSHYRSIAADMATDLGDRIRANRSPFMATSTSANQPPLAPDFSKCTVASLTASTPACDAQVPSSLPTYLMTTEMIEWYTALRTELPQGTFNLTSTAAGSQYRYKLDISWLDDRSASAASSAASSSASSSSASSSAGSSAASTAATATYSVVIE